MASLTDYFFSVFLFWWKRQTPLINRSNCGFPLHANKNNWNNIWQGKMCEHLNDRMLWFSVSYIHEVVVSKRQARKKRVNRIVEPIVMCTKITVAILLWIICMCVCALCIVTVSWYPCIVHVHCKQCDRIGNGKHQQRTSNIQKPQLSQYF